MANGVHCQRDCRPPPTRLERRMSNYAAVAPASMSFATPIHGHATPAEVGAVCERLQRWRGELRTRLNSQPKTICTLRCPAPWRLGKHSNTLTYAYFGGNASALTSTVKDTSHIVRAGINYRF
jgi:hypothetical protein